MKHIVLIPAYCPDEKLITTVREVIQANMQCIVVDDGSGDAYQEIFEAIKEDATILKHEINRGKGAALKTGLRYLNEHNIQGIIITADADGQHHTNDMVSCANAVDCHQTMVLGTRNFHEKHVPWKSRFGNQITSAIFYLSTHQKVNDTQTGLRAFHSSLIPFLLDIEGDHYEYEMNVLIACAKQDISFKQVPIQTIYENNNASSHFHVFRDSYLIYKELLAFALSSIFSFFVDFILFILLGKLFTFASGILYANIVARIISATVNYELNRKSVFKDQRKRRESLYRYIVLAWFILLANTSLLYIFVNVLHLPAIPSKLFVEIILFVFSWSMQKTHIFVNGGQL